MANQDPRQYDKTPAECDHEAFASMTYVERDVDDDGRVTFRADLQVNCSQCGERFKFVGAMPADEQLRLCTRIVPASAIPAPVPMPGGSGILVDPPDARLKRGPHVEQRGMPLRPGITPAGRPRPMPPPGGPRMKP